MLNTKTLTPPPPPYFMEYKNPINFTTLQKYSLVHL